MWQNIVFSFLPMIYIIGFLTVIAKNLEVGRFVHGFICDGYAIAYPLMVGYAWFPEVVQTYVFRCQLGKAFPSGRMK